MGLPGARTTRPPRATTSSISPGHWDGPPGEAGGVTGAAPSGTACRVRISLNWDSGFRKSRTSVSLSRGQRMRSISGCLVSVTGD
ncbi:hypothetical protein ELI10_36275 [Rhizobium ruizarguesonis]|nr:hypothetical protein ELI10_36275 [Rhizobium ruizarguesonis]